MKMLMFIVCQMLFSLSCKMVHVNYLKPKVISSLYSCFLWTQSFRTGKLEAEDIK